MEHECENCGEMGPAENFMPKCPSCGAWYDVDDNRDAQDAWI